ncbi:hypothetical protein DL93DRAFT_2106788 [Clavulina sp. PMI_390]|nr:hypothetical protein DL93DRAFT_2106788 [Clavulina sp. PMI_390]
MDVMDVVFECLAWFPPSSYKRRLAMPYTLPKVTMKDINDAVPKWCHERRTDLALFYSVRMALTVISFFALAARIPYFVSLAEPLGVTVQQTIRYALWGSYWVWQSFAFSGLWTIAHDCGHGNAYPHSWLNNLNGYLFYSFVLIPYYNWKFIHDIHHSSLNSIERDEHFCPVPRSEWPTGALPPPTEENPSKYSEVLEEVPVIVAVKLLFQQVFGIWAYLAVNLTGNVKYGVANHFSPYSPLFPPNRASHRALLLSDAAIAGMIVGLGYYAYTTSFRHLMAMYFVPYFLMNHWLTGILFLQHTDPTVPYFRKSAWTSIRSAASSSVDRPTFGDAVGRYFFTALAHDHVAHHLYGRMPYYNLQYATPAIKKVLGPHYNRDSTNFFRSLWRNFTQCQFINDEDPVLFYHNSKGVQLRAIDDSVWEELTVSPPVTPLKASYASESDCGESDSETSSVKSWCMSPVSETSESEGF